MPQAPISRHSDARRRVLAAVHAAVQRWNLAGAPLVVGVSGGADSVALLRAFLELEDSRPVLALAHIDHQLRPSSAEDAAWLEQQGAAWGVPVVVRRVDAAAAARERGAGLEETARDLRYEALADEAEARGARFVAVAHTADDQAETVLHHLARGSGLAGAAGMEECRLLRERVRIVRPLLTIGRTDTVSYLEELGQPYRVDPSNDDPRHTRNRIRQRVLPVLEQELHPRVRESLCRFAEQCRDAQTVIDDLVRPLLAASRTTWPGSSPGSVVLECRRLEPFRRAVIQAVLVELWRQQGWPRGEMEQAHWVGLAELVRAPQARRPSLGIPGGIAVEKRDGMLVLDSRRATS